MLFFLFIACFYDTFTCLLLGKSLDKIMQLKERTGNRDMFDVMKKKHKLSAPAQKRPKKTANMFEYLNKSLGHGKKSKLIEDRR